MSVPQGHFAEVIVVRPGPILQRADQRKFFRVPVHVPISFSVLSEVMPHRWTGKTEDMTPGGLSLVTARPLAVGDRLELAIALYVATQSAKPHKIRTTGKVVRVVRLDDSEMHLVGIELASLREVEQLSLARFLFGAQKSASSS